MKFFLYSLHASPEQWRYLDECAGKSAHEISMAMIENAADIIPDSSGWVMNMRNAMAGMGYQVEAFDLRYWMNKKEELRERLLSKDVIWISGGHTYYLRWILHASGADKIICEMVKAGKIYAGWSAGAVIAGPTIQCFDLMGDDPEQAPALISDGLGLTDFIIVPHADNSDFSEGALQVNSCLHAFGYDTILLNDNQAVIVNDDLTVRLI